MTLVATPTLRIVKRTVAENPVPWTRDVLQQWWAPDVPGFMRSDNEGEWRDVPVVTFGSPRVMGTPSSDVTD